MTVKLPPDIAAKMNATIRHVQQNERAGAMERARELGEMLGAMPRMFDKHTGNTPVDATRSAVAQLKTVFQAIAESGNMGLKIAERVQAFFDEVIRQSPNPYVKNNAGW